MEIAPRKKIAKSSAVEIIDRAYSPRKTMSLGTRTRYYNLAERKRLIQWGLRLRFMPKTTVSSTSPTKPKVLWTRWLMLVLLAMTIIQLLVSLH